jgi:hypothetical protein
MQLSTTVASDFRKTEAQVLGDYLLLRIGPGVGGNHDLFILQYT